MGGSVVWGELTRPALPPVSAEGNGEPVSSFTPGRTAEWRELPVPMWARWWVGLWGARQDPRLSCEFRNLK